MPDRCRAMVDGGGVSSYRCNGDVGHDKDGEPHWSHEADRSIARRDRWRAEDQARQAHQDSGLGQFQGRPQTTSERYTDDATPVPGGGEAPVTEYPGTVATRPVTPAYDRVSRALGTTPTPDDPMHTEDYHNGDEALRERDGDQRLPVASDAPVSHEEVRKDLLARLELGISRYGQPLQAHNGRNSFLDAYEEVLDLSVYLKTLQIERADFCLGARRALDAYDQSEASPESIQGLVDLVENLYVWLSQ